MNVSLSEGEKVAIIYLLYGDPQGQFGTKDDIQEYRRYSLHVKSGGSPCFLNEVSIFRPMAVVSREINGKVVHISAWEDMPLKAGDRIHALWLGVKVQPLTGGIIAVPPSSPEAYIADDGYVKFRGVTKNWVTEFFRTGALAKFQKKEWKFTGFDKTGIRG